MTKPPIVFLLLFLLLGDPIHAQETQLIIVKGIVLNYADSTPVQFVNIFDQQSHNGAISGIEGHFTINVHEGDTLRFTAVGFETFYLLAENSNTEITIKLKQTNYQIEQVTVTPFMNKAMFKKAFMAVPPDPNQITLNLPPQKEVTPLGDTKGPTYKGAFLFGADPVLTSIRRQTKEIHRWENKFADQAMVDAKYNKTVIKQWINIPDKDLEAFIKFCNLNNEFIAGANAYDIGAAVKQCYVAYQEQSAKSQEH